MKSQPSKLGSLIHFFDLPLEIRLQIYYHCLVHPYPVPISGLCLSRLAPARILSVRRRNILLLCRQTYNEAVEMIYKYNTFQLSSWDNAIDTIDSPTGGFEMSRIRHLELVAGDLDFTTYSRTIPSKHLYRRYLIIQLKDNRNPLSQLYRSVLRTLQTLTISCTQPPREKPNVYWFHLTFHMWLTALRTRLSEILSQMPNLRVLEIDDGDMTETIALLKSVFPEGYRKTRTESCDQYYRRGKHDDAERSSYRDEALEMVKRL